MHSETRRHTRRQFCLSPVVAGILAAETRSVSAASPFLEKVEVFRSGQSDYKIFRIPGIVTTKRGTVLTYAEARRHTSSDWDTIDLVIRRSTDGGRTFAPFDHLPRIAGKIERNPVAIEHKLAQPTDVTYNNPVALPDRNGRVHFLFCVEYMRVFYTHSDDDGVTFAPPVEITETFAPARERIPWRVVATGPGHGIETRGGRLLVPVWLSEGVGSNGHGSSVCGTIYSNDHGKSWRFGGVAIPSTDEFPSPNESVLVELADGRILMNTRTTSRRNRRAVTISPDGIGRWSEPRFQEDLPDPICAAGLARYSTKQSGGVNRLLFSNPDCLTRADGRDIANKDRRNLTVRLSVDEGASWTVSRVLDPGPSGYSDLTVLPDRTILCVYEGKSGEVDAQFPVMTLARFNLEWLTEGGGKR